MTLLYRLTFGLFAVFFAVCGLSAADKTLSLNEAISLAIQSSDPSVEMHRAQAAMLKDMAVVAGQLPDPKVRFGLSNLAVDSFSLTQEPMTSIQLGVHQSFTSKAKRKLSGREVLAKSNASLHAAHNRQLLIERDIKQIYMQLVHNHALAKLINQKQQTLKAISASLESRLAHAKGQATAILDLQTELALLDDKLQETEQNKHRLQSFLARYIGPKNAVRPVAKGYASLALPQPIQLIKSDIASHPALLVEEAMIKAGDHSVALAKEDYKPNWGVDVGYAQRGAGRADMATAMVTMNVPLFTNKRQDKKLSAAKKARQSAMLKKRAAELEMIKSASASFAVWVKAGTRIDLYKKVILSRTDAASKASENAFATGRGDYTSFIRSHLSELNARIKLEDVKLQQAQATINLHYYAAATTAPKGADQ